MIRVLQKADIDRVVDIWLDTNVKAHYFIPAQYWESNIELVKKMLPQAEVYVYENNCQREGFEIQCEGLDEVTGEKDYVMVWRTGNFL